MKQLFYLAGILLALGQTPAWATDFQQLQQTTQQMLQQAESGQDLAELNHNLLEMYLWSKDNFELRQWPELWPSLETWPSLLKQRSQQLNGLDNEFRALEASYLLLIHDYPQAQKLIQQLPARSSSPYPDLLRALLGEQDPENPGIWRISLEQAQRLSKRFPRLDLAQLLVAEAALERVQEPGSEPALLKIAQAAVSQVLSQDAKQAFARYQQGQILYLQERPDEARLYFEQKVAPLGALPAEAVGNFYVWMQDAPAALAFYELARQQAPLLMRVYNKLEQLYVMTQPGAALRLYLKALAQNPQESVFYQRLQSLYDQAQPEQLRQWLKQDLPANSYLSRLILGDLALREQDFKTALHWYEKALAQEPQRIEAYQNLLGLYWGQRNIEAMSGLLTKARSQQLQNPELNYWSAVMALQQGQITEAIDLLGPLAETDGRARYTLAMAYRQQKNFAKARELIASLIEQEPQNVSLILGLGDLYLEERRFEEAEEVYELARRMEPYNPSIYFSLGNLYSENKRYSEAVDALERAILLAPDDLDFRNNLGNIYIRQQRFDAAQEQFQAIVDRRPDYAAAYYNLACVYALNQEKELALRYLQRAFELDAGLKQTARDDSDLESLRSDQRFQELLR